MLMRKPYSIFREKVGAGLMWYARFWSEKKGKYAYTRSLGILIEGKRERKREAWDKAEQLYIEIKKLSPDPKIAHNNFLDYVLAFWTPQSEYVREKALVEKKPMSAAYIQNSRYYIENYAKGFSGFQGITLADLHPALIREYKLWAAEKGYSGRLINFCLQAMRVPIRNAFKNEYLPRDPFAVVGKAAHTEKEKGVLTPEEVSKLIASPITNPYHRLAVLLGLLCGMRRGEIRGLKWGDIGDKLIHICHNYVDSDGEKGPKWNSVRYVPILEEVQEVLNKVRLIKRKKKPEDFVIVGKYKGQVVSAKYTSWALKGELDKIGISPEEQSRRNISFHSLRHTFVTLGRIAGINDILMQALTGQKSIKVMGKYTHGNQVIDFDEAKNKLGTGIKAV